jgi:microcompartment protein CcmK/EutM
LSSDDATWSTNLIVGRVIGTVVCTQKDHRMEGTKLLVVQPVSLADLSNEGKPLVAVDTVGSGVGELVMVCSGSSARQTSRTTNTPTDASIMGILDSIELQGRLVYHKDASG